MRPAGAWWTDTEESSEPRHRRKARRGRERAFSLACVATVDNASHRRGWGVGCEVGGMGFALCGSSEGEEERGKEVEPHGSCAVWGMA